MKLGHLPPDMARDELLELGEAYGGVLHHDVWPDKNTGAAGGVIEYGKRDEAIKALSDVNDRRMEGWDKKITACLEQRDN